MRDLSRFRRYLTEQAIHQAMGDYDEHGVMPNTLRLFDTADHVYEQAEGFEERLSLRDEITKQEVYTFTRAEASRLVEEGADILGVHETLKLLVRCYGFGPLTHKLAALAKEKTMVKSQV